MIVNNHTLFNKQPIKNMLLRKEQAHGVSHGLGEAGYDIRIKQDIWFWPASYAHNVSRSYIRPPVFAVDDKDTRIHGTFCLASAIEEFDMPTDLVGIVHDKSTWARQGLSVFNTVIEPGWKGHLTLELVYHGREPLHIPAGAGIAQVIFHQTTNHVEYRGKYQNQADEPVASVFQ